MRTETRKIPRKNIPKLIFAAFSGLVLVVFIITVFSVSYRIHEVHKEISECNEAIVQRQNELKQLEQKKAYYESDEYLEDAVRANGYVDEDETVFVVTN